MITETDIANALQQHLAAMPGVPPIAWENRESTLAPPYILCEIVRVSRPNYTVAGRGDYSTGYLLASILTQPDTFATPALTLADDILAHFPPNEALIAPTGKVMITGGRVLDGYNDGLYWRTPARIDYRAY